jgi:prefoldin beta subunit
MDAETQSKIQQLQLFEQNMQGILMQKQQVQAQKIEVENALTEINDAKGDVFKIVGPIMIASSKEVVKKDLEGKKEVVDIKIKNLEKQETQIREKASKLQAEVMEKMQPAK